MFAIIINVVATTATQTAEATTGRRAKNEVLTEPVGAADLKAFRLSTSRSLKTIQRKVILYKNNDARARKTRDDGVITVRFLMSETP